MPFPLVKLPPLDLVRGFVAVARRMSITQAAQDLHVTQSAVSRQIRSLEAHLGVALLTRGFRSVSLTPEGAQLFRLADPWLTELGELSAQWRTPGRRLPVTVTTTIGVASLWLLPRLGAFQAEHPDIDVRVAADNRIMDLDREGVEIAIRYCTAEHVSEEAHWLFGETVLPVAHPSFDLPSLDAAALRELVLLEFDDPTRPWLQWGTWLDARGLSRVRPKSILRFNQYDQVVHAALAGNGVALGRCALIAPMLAQGRLRPVGGEEPGDTPLAYWLVRNPRRPSRDADVVANWLLAQAASP
ncbi:LysR substrate-binding domain-containing protein [Bordetella avium]|uniref:LysR-family transcriptional regulator n=1 Tax=Bordetella avium (strain 197N) TaxID=360910 RepID=Q2KUA1_BORA1|nr:LysR substrate-binding domain-containing protein [Bordetella avium]AZY50481.1 LysR family transcriptional regulator [Bordetella avium]AZY53877.1 LysR family transcriptional regulator [Bordetella avium]RIQ19845.1 LysR family transcriptional regulator [Bordetella avium]RIQ34424.1 LysR family transcriptional regulator [Bordetella avium]RIQ55606.1 LysR family transcriptional regulator [Bordetella avium]